ncbi:MAG: hypothetical protein MJ248_05290 [Bacilli bacterium]|nr:hypothetical protein [Bacilli bacterium]
MNKFTKFLKVFSYVLVAAVFAAGAFLLIAKGTNNKTHLNEAVVINNDHDFHKEIEFVTDIVPGGEAVQEINVKSQISTRVDYTLTFTAEDSSTLDMVTYKINETSIDEVTGNLKESIDNQTTYKFSLSGKKETTISITYFLDFAFNSEEIKSFNFSIAFDAKGGTI